MDIKLQYTKVFEKTVQCTKPLIIEIGGTGSGKTWSLLQIFLYRLLSCNNRESLLVRETLPALKKTTLNEFEKILSNSGLMPYIAHHKSERYFEYKKKKNKIWYGSTDNPYEYKSGSFNDIWIEESNRSAYNSYQILSMYNRAPETDGLPNQIFLSYNPDDEYSWEKVELIDKLHPEEFELIHSTFDDNPFYPEIMKKRIERLQDTDATLYKIYRLGEYGTIKNKIYPDNWDQEWKEVRGEKFYGLDHGWNDPKVLLEFIKYDGELYERELIYESELKGPELIRKMETLGIDRSSPIYAPPDDPETNDDIYKAGFNLQDATTDVYAGIIFCKKYRFHIHPESVNDLKETRNYKWKEDRNGKVLDEPIGDYNHAQDARRYAVYTHLKNESAPFATVVGESVGRRFHRG